MLGFRNQSATSCWPPRGGAMAWSATTEPGPMGWDNSGSAILKWGWPIITISNPPENMSGKRTQPGNSAETMCRLIWSKTSSLEFSRGCLSFWIMWWFACLWMGFGSKAAIGCRNVKGIVSPSSMWTFPKTNSTCDPRDGRSPLPAPHSHRFIAVWGDSPQDKDETIAWIYDYIYVYIYIICTVLIAYRYRSWLHCNATCCNEESTAALDACFDFSTSSWLCSKGWGAFNDACDLKPLKTRQQRMVDARFCEIMA